MLVSSVMPASRARSSNRSTSSRTSASSRTRSPSSLPDSSRDRSSRSATIRDRRIASRSNCDANRGTAAGSRCATDTSVSAAAWIEAAGVLSSCEALATKSRRTASMRRVSVMSVTTSRMEPSLPVGVTAARSHRVGSSRPNSIVPDAVRPGDAPEHLSQGGRIELVDGLRAGAQMPHEGVVRERGPLITVEEQDPFLHRTQGQVLHPATVVVRSFAVGHRVGRTLECCLQGSHASGQRTPAHHDAAPERQGGQHHHEHNDETVHRSSLGSPSVPTHAKPASFIIQTPSAAVR